MKPGLLSDTPKRGGRDLESTARLPVLDIAAYEAELAALREAQAQAEAEALRGTASIPVLRQAALTFDEADADAELLGHLAPGPAAPAVHEGPASAAVPRAAAAATAAAEVAAADPVAVLRKRVESLDSQLQRLAVAMSDVDLSRRDAEARATEAQMALESARTARDAAESRVTELQALQALHRQQALGLAAQHRAQLQEVEFASQARLAATQAEIERLRENARHAEGRRGIWESLVFDAERARDGEIEALRQRHDELQRVAAETAPALQRALDAERRALASEARARAAEQRASVAEQQAAAADTQGEQLRAEAVALQLLATSPAAAAASAEADLATADSLRLLQQQVQSTGERIGELETDLRAAEDQINRLEGELRVKSARLEEAARNGSPQPDRAAAVTGVASSRRRSDDPSASSAAATTNSAETTTRYLVFMDGDTEIVHVLGRRTTVGRGLENDIRIDTKYVSRNHAVVIGGPSQTIVEDLRSTNGVLINGRRVARAALRDGDVVHFGKSQFRFVQRSRDRG